MYNELVEKLIMICYNTVEMSDNNDFKKRKLY